MRRLPIYLVVDTSDSMTGEAMDSVCNGIQELLNVLQKDPGAVDTAYVSLITYGGKADQVVPLIDLPSFELPVLNAGGECRLGAALDLLCECRGREVVKTTSERKGDYKPYVFIFTSGMSDDDIGPAADRLHSLRWECIASLVTSDGVDNTLLNRISPGNIVSLERADAPELAAFFRWYDDSVITNDSVRFEDLPPPPIEVQVVNERQEGDVISVKGESGHSYEYIWTATSQSGAMKDVYLAPDKSYAIVFFKEPLDACSLERMESLVSSCHERIFSGLGGEYWEKLFCWPRDIIREGDKVGVVVPTYKSEFFFRHDGPKIQLAGMEKEGKWFVDPWHRYCNLDERERGDFRGFLNVCLLLARGVRRVHEAGWAWTSLDYKALLIDPVSGGVCFTSILDNLIVPDKYPPDFLGTPDFIAPEVYETMSLPKADPNRKLPCQDTDCHSLAVLIYMLLLCRHPLRGKKIWDNEDPQADEQLAMGAKAVFIEDPTNTCNRFDVEWVRNDRPKSRFPYLMPWMDLDKLPYTILGPHLKNLIARAFIQGLHNPSARPKADEWERAIVDTMDLLIPCENPNCKQKWFVFDNSATHPMCPFCGAAYTTPLPVLNLYNREATSYRPTGVRVMVFNGTRLYPWHSNPNIVRDEKITEEQKKSIACFQFHQGKWYLRNERALGMMDLQTKQPIAAGSVIELKDGVQIRLDDEQSRMIHVQMVNKGG